ncbi:MAG TPA: hypothetical protein ENG54_01350 [Thermofilum sp.]|nr:hypothetical protein [Thermofilum sp.]
MPTRLDAKDKRILILLNEYGKPVSRQKLHRMIYELQKEKNVKFNFTFYGSPPFSVKLQNKLEKMVERGYIRVLYLVGPGFLRLYTDYYAITEKGKQIAAKKDIDKKDIKKIEEYVNEMRQSLAVSPTQEG